MLDAAVVGQREGAKEYIGQVAEGVALSPRAC